MADTGDADRNASLPDGTKLQRMLLSSEPMVWVFWGDSVTQGMNVHLHGARSYVELWQEMVRWELRCGEENRLNDTVVNLAQSAETAAHFLGRETLCMSSLQPQVVFINYGINEALYGISPDAYRSALSDLVERARARGALPVLIVPPLTRTPVVTVRQYEQAVRSLAQEKNVLLVDFAADWRNRLSGADKAPCSWMADDFHPNAVGHRILHRTMARSLNIAPKYSETLLLPTDGAEWFSYQWHCVRRLLSTKLRRWLHK